MALKDNLLAWWALEETSGDRYDSHGSYDLEEHGTAVGYTSSGKKGNASNQLESNSPTTWLERATTSDFSFGDSDFSIAGWFKTPDWNAGDSWARDLVSKYLGGGSPQREFFLSFYDQMGGGVGSINRFCFGCRDSTDSTWTYLYANTFGAVSPTYDDTWVFVACYHDSVNNLIGISINGGAFDTTAFSGGIQNTNTNTPLVLGTGNNGQSRLMANVDEVAIWSRVLTSGDISDLYNSGTGITYSEIGAHGGAGTNSFFILGI